jgi:hypothetical protein
MTPTQLQKIGEACFGPTWQSALAREIGVGDRQVRQWVAGDRIIPAEAERKIVVLVRHRATALKKLADALSLNPGVLDAHQVESASTGSAARVRGRFAS